MDNHCEKNGIWLVYDGACPLCSKAVHAIRLADKYGPLHLINARGAGDNPLVLDIIQRGLDLDAGMVVYTGGRFYHGKDALTFIAESGDARTIIMRLCKILFRSDMIASLTYPWMRGLRNFWLRRTSAGRIHDPD